MQRIVSSSVVVLGAAFLLAIGPPLAACSSSDVVGTASDSDAAVALDAATIDAPLPDDGGPKSVPKPTFPEVQSRGGAVVATPKVVAIVFAGDPLASQITEFTSKIGASTFWNGLAQEYGVGAMTALDTIVVDEPAPTQVRPAAIESWLSGKLSGATPAFGAPDGSTLYAVYYPATTTVTTDRLSSELGGKCQGYVGYHAELNVGGTQVGYAVLPRCSDIDELTVAASHEYFEWATNPFPDTKPAYGKIDDAHWAWQAAFVADLGELCTYVDPGYVRPADLGFRVQTMWSNKASLAGKFPCAPRIGTAYVQGIPTAEDVAIVPSTLPNVPDITTKAIRVTAGQSRAVNVLVYSDQPRAEPIQLRAITFNEFIAGMRDEHDAMGYRYTVEPSVAKVGDIVSLRIDAPTATKYDLLVVVAQTSDSTTYWPALVVNDEAR
jgi:hypothetical protein